MSQSASHSNSPPGLQRISPFLTVFATRCSRSAALPITKCCDCALGPLEALCGSGSLARGFMGAAATMRVRDLQADRTGTHDSFAHSFSTWGQRSHAAFSGAVRDSCTARIRQPHGHDVTWRHRAPARVSCFVAALVAVAALAPCLASAAQAGDRQVAAAPVAPPVESAPKHVAEPEVAPSLGAVFREVPRDVLRFVSKDTAIVLAGGGSAALLAHLWDDDLASEPGRTLRLINALEPGNTYGTFAAMMAGSFAVYGIGRAAGHGHMSVVGADLIRSQFVTQVWVQGIKFAIRRERPDGSNDVSFPSGHTAGGFAAASVLGQHYGWKASIPAYIGAIYIAAARVDGNKHYLSDVVFGAAMGLAGTRTVVLKPGRYGAKLVPAVTPDQIALGLVLVPLRQ